MKRAREKTRTDDSHTHCPEGWRREEGCHSRESLERRLRSEVCVDKRMREGFTDV